MVAFIFDKSGKENISDAGIKELIQTIKDN